MDILCFFLSCICYAFVSVCLYVPCGHLLGRHSFVVCNCEFVTYPLVSRGQVWRLIVSIPDLCTLTYYVQVNVFLKL